MTNQRKNQNKAALSVTTVLMSAPLVQADSFGSGPNTFDMNFVTIGNAGNNNDGASGTTAYGVSGTVNSTIALWPSGDAWQVGGENLFRHKDAHYFLPSENEWYKVAYYNPDTGTYFNYATGSDIAPTATSGGTASGTAVYGQNAKFTSPADITNAGGLSPYGTMAQNGNVWEWGESALDGSNIRLMSLACSAAAMIPSSCSRRAVPTPARPSRAAPSVFVSQR